MISISSIFNSNVTIRKPHKPRKGSGSAGVGKGVVGTKDKHVNPTISSLFMHGLDSSVTAGELQCTRALRELAQDGGS